ncbi:universal stress protein [Halogeometricum borinquense]|uniref:Universal stress protein n=1 Tax=Halogeometricum borinquense TaxID=60847 RepID=A0A6C0UHF8_9EURY|nr:universal stress protein [Halogeometricum borinquense]QIB74984.1 universal stress protein [Halogeometricum borinquense]QIQ76038.1 universal stress protein [Halogeometricum borinquense]
MMYQRILVPTDGSPGSERVLEHAVELASVHGATVHALYVINSGSFAGLPMESSWEGLDEMLHEDAEAAIADVRAIAERSNVQVETSIVEGTPSREIVRLAERGGCDLIVMGTHGRGGIDRLLLGSVAEKVVRASMVPVLTVRVGEEDTESENETEAKSKADSETNSDVESDGETETGVGAD